MKAEERHELKENDLASWFQYGLPIFLKQNGSYLLLVLALGFLGYQLYQMYERKQESTRVTAWEELRSAMNGDNPPAKFQSIIDTYDIKQVRTQAYLRLGAYYAEMAMYPERADKLKLTRAEVLDKEFDAYKKVLDMYGEDSLIAAQAILGLAATEEDRGNWEEARKYYEMLADKSGRFKDSSFIKVGESNIAALAQRKNAPRLAAMMPATTKPLGFPLDNLPGAFGQQLPGGVPSIGPEPASAPSGAGGGIGTGGGAFAAPLPGMALPTLPPTEVAPATAPATVPK